MDDAGDYPMAWVEEPQLKKTSGEEKETQTDDGEGSGGRKKKIQFPWSGMAEGNILGGPATCFTRGQHIYYFAGVSKDSIYAM